MKTEKGRSWLILVPILFWGSIGTVTYVLTTKQEKKLRIEAEQANPMAVSGIARVMIHESGHYSFLVRQKTGKLGQLTVRMNPMNIEIIENLSDKESVGIEILCGTTQWPKNCKSLPESFSYWSITSANRLVIHLHSARQIDGAGWNHGKFGRGTTTIIE